MFSIKRTVIGAIAAFAIGVFAVALPIAGGSVSADGGAPKSAVVKYMTIVDSDINPDTGISGIRCEDDECLKLAGDGGIYSIRCEDQDCLRPISSVAIPDGGTVLLGGLK